jgi:hypothetical protein
VVPLTAVESVNCVVVLEPMADPGESAFVDL